MADFTLNPSVGGVPSANMPDQTNASRGAIPDRSFGVIAEGLGQAAQTAAGIYNDYNHYQIDQAVRTGFDTANKPYFDTLPGELTGSVTAMQQLQSAYEQGKISDTYYTGQLAAMSKKLRAQYPLYEDYVDKSIQSITGIRPANAYKNAVDAEFAKQEEAKKAKTQSEDTWVNQHGDSLARVAPGFFQDRSKYNLDEVKAKVYEYEAQYTDLQRETMANSVLDSQNKLTVQAAEESATRSLNFTVQTAVAGISNSTIGFNVPDLLKNIQKYATEGGSPQEAQMMLSQLGILRTSVLNQITQQVNKSLADDPNSRSYAQILGPDGTKKLIDQAMIPIDNMIQFATDKNWGLMTYYSNLNSLTQDKNLNTVLNVPEIGLANALSKVSPDLATQFINSSGFQEGKFAQLVPEMVSQVVTKGNDTLTGQVDRMANARVDAATKAGGINALIDSYKAAIVSGKATPEEFKNAVTASYGVDKSGKSIFSYVKEDERLQLWKTMYAPDITKAIVDNGDKELMDLYATSALEAGNGLPELSKAAAAIQDVQDWSKASTIKWSPENNTLLVVTDPSKFDGPSTPTMLPTTRVGQLAQQKQAKYATDAIDSINTVFAQIGPILDAEGVSVEDKSKIMKQFVDNLNIDLSSGKKDTFFDWLGKGMNTIATNVDSELGKVDPNKGMATQLDFNFNTYNDTVAKLSAASTYNDKVRGKESGGNDNAANPNSSATGRYQIIDSTYNRYAKRLGLTGDKNDPANQEAVMQAYTQDSVDSLQSNNLDVTDGNLYLLHFLGQDAGVNVLESDPSIAISDILPSRVIKANPFLTGMTVADLQSWANKKMK